MQNFIKKLKIFFIVAAIVLTIIFSLFIYFQARILKQGKTFLEESLSKEINLRIEFADVNIDWMKILKFTPSVQIKNFKLANPENFRARDFIEAESISVELDLWKLLEKNISIKSIIINKPKIHLEQNPDGAFNLDKVIHELTKKPAPISIKFNKDTKKTPAATASSQPVFEFDKLSLDELIINKGQISLISYANRQSLEVFSIDDLSFKTLNFATDKESTIELQFSILGTKAQNIKYQGKVGPFGEGSIPSTGVLDFSLLIKDIPKEMRKKYFGEILLEPQSTDKLAFAINLKGDLMDKLAGGGSIKITELHLGKPKDRQITVQGNLPIYLSLVNLATIPQIYFNLNKSKLQINSESSIDLALKASLVNRRITGSATGSVKGIEINTMLSAFTEYRDQLYGSFEIPNFKLDFNGSDADELLTSLKGDGLISIKNGHFELLEKIFKIKGIITDLIETKAQIKNIELDKFLSIEAPFVIENRKFKNDRIEIVTSLTTIRGAGYFSFDDRIDYQLRTTILANEIPIDLEGSFAKPRINVHFEQVIKQQLNKQLETFLDKINQYGKTQLKKKLDEAKTAKQKITQPIQESSSPTQEGTVIQESTPTQN